MLRHILLALGLLFLELPPALADEDVEEDAEEEEEGEKEPDIIDGFSKDDLAKMAEGAETHDFQAEVSRLMDIIINSLYGSKDIFLRELLSNAGDALERARFSQIQDSAFPGPKELEIKVTVDEAAKTLSITDTGVGMTKRELIENLGTVAKSGTTNFLEALKDGGGDASTLIGQFGVGFYSAFLVADTVYVTSVSNDDPTQQHIWQSSADGSFSLSVDPRGPTLGRGSRITLALKEEALEYMKKDKIESIVNRYSQFMTHPILMKDDTAAADDDEDDELDDEDEEKEEKEDKAVKEKWKKVNKQQPIWLRSRDDITEAEYHEFYKAIGKDVFEPLAYTHFNAEGDIEFKSILYIPKRAPHDMNMGNVEGWSSDIKLYVRRVLVADSFETLLPRYLTWVKGVVDSDDLPLNVNREQLQQNKILKVISKKLTRKVLEMLKKLAKDEKEEDEDDEEDDEDEKAPSAEKTSYEKFYDEFKNFLLMGCHEDDANRSKISKLLRFLSSWTEAQEHKKPSSLEDYVGRMQEEQPAIYYMTGDKVKDMQKEVALQIYVKKGLEVLMLDDPYAEQCVSKISDFEGVKLRSVQKAGDLRINWSKDEAQRYKDFTTMYKPLTKWWEKHTANAGVQITKVEISRRLTTSPAVVVSTEFGFSARQERLNKVNDQQDAGFSTAGKVLEINPDHPVIYDLLQKAKAASEDDEDSALEETANLVAQAAVLESGFELDDPQLLVNTVYDLMSMKHSLDPKAPVTPIEVVLPEEPKVEDEAEVVEDDDEEEGADEEDEPEKPEL